MRGKVLVRIVALMIALCMPVMALADTWYLEDGDITIQVQDGGQQVSQAGGATKMDAAPIITNRDPDSATRNSVIVSGSGSAPASFTLKDVNISSRRDSGIDVGAGEAVITLEGNNAINTSDEEAAGIHVSSGSVTIQGSGSLQVTSEDSAAIGSVANEDMNGSISIKGEVQVQAVSQGVYSGAAIGSGYGSDMDGSIDIDLTGNGRVKASSEGGAGIGAGINGDMGEDSSITIGGSGTVDAFSADRGAAIGTGSRETMAGTITIQDSAQVNAYGGSNAPAIGGRMEGSIQILDQVQVTTGVSNDSGGAGSGIGYIGLDEGKTDGDYTVSETATINNVSGDDVESLAEFMNLNLDAQGNATNLTVVKAPADQLDVAIGTGMALQTQVWTAEKDIWMEGAFQDADGLVVSELPRESAEFEQLMADVKGELWHVMRLQFAGSHDGSAFRLKFNLGTAYAGAQVELRVICNGELQIYHLQADKQGVVTLETTNLGYVALILK